MPNFKELAQSSQESAELDFKASINFDSRGDFCEIIKDILAMANSGGGLILVGVNNDGTSSGIDIDGIIKYDPANITNKIYSYTGKHFDRFKIYPVERNGTNVAAIQVERSSFPIVFTSPGTYTIENNKQKTAFSLGTVYFRHGAKSEPGNSDDLMAFIKREVDAIKEYWLDSIRKVVEAPEGSKIMIVPLDANISRSEESQGFRITDNPNAPALRVQEDDIFRNYPYDYRALTDTLKLRYSDFIENRRYHKLRKLLESVPTYCNMRLLNPRKPNSSKTCFYSRAILLEFDKHYTRHSEEKDVSSQ